MKNSKADFDSQMNDFFTGLWIEVQNNFYSEKQSLEHAKFIIDVMSLHGKKKILDIPCGNGRISNILSRKGFDVTGIDFNKHLLNFAKKEALKKKLKTRFFNISMFDIKWENEFDSAICFWGSFGYSTDENNINFLREIYSSLGNNGKFLIDTVTAETLLPKFQRRGWMKIGDIYILEDRTYNTLNSRIDVEWTFIKKNKAEIKHTSIRLYTYKELINIMKDIGFREFSSYGSLKKDKFTINSNRLYLIAIR